MPENMELAELQTIAEAVINLRLRSKAATIRRLRPDLIRFAKLGYSHEQILAVLIQSGLGPTTLGTFQTTLAREKKALDSRN
jgi:hypothetical protein